jgi:hypothetical protein
MMVVRVETVMYLEDLLSFVLLTEVVVAQAPILAVQVAAQQV